MRSILSIALSVLFLAEAATARDTSKILLTDPILQDPTHDSVKVVWYTKWWGYGENFVLYGTIGNHESPSRWRPAEALRLNNAPASTTWMATPNPAGMPKSATPN